MPYNKAGLVMNASSTAKTPFYLNAETCEQMHDTAKQLMANKALLAGES